ncbi:hypothetical protein ACLB2K_063686 [Fragaria x ananassa]
MVGAASLQRKSKDSNPLFKAKADEIKAALETGRGCTVIIDKKVCLLSAVNSGHSIQVNGGSGASKNMKRAMRLKVSSRLCTSAGLQVLSLSMRVFASVDTLISDVFV